MCMLEGDAVNLSLLSKVKEMLIRNVVNSVCRRGHDGGPQASNLRGTSTDSKRCVCYVLQGT